MQSSRNALQRNVRLFSSYKAATSVSPWLPVFSLFFLERVSLAEAVLLGSVYYFAVFFLEVPSGYCSDRFGRRPTLIAASVATALACIVFIAAPSFQILAVAQVLLAAGMAFQSGSDSALLYDSLCLLERQDEYSQLESTAQKWSMTALACACLFGGAIGMIDLRLAYVAALVAAIAATLLCCLFVEPEVQGNAPAAGFITQMGKTVSYFAHPLLAWILGFFIIGFALQHIPFEFYQPYVKLLGENSVASWLSSGSTPLVSGVVFSVSMSGGAIGAAMSEYLDDRLGLRALLVVSIAIQIIIIAGLSLFLHPLMLILVMLRNFAMSMARGPMLGAIAPHVSSAQRATFLSLLSLSGRAVFSVILAIFSVSVIDADESLDWSTLSQILTTATWVGVSALAALYIWSRFIHSEFSRLQSSQAK